MEHDRKEEREETPAPPKNQSGGLIKSSLRQKERSKEVPGETREDMWKNWQRRLKKQQR